MLKDSMQEGSHAGKWQKLYIPNRRQPTRSSRRIQRWSSRRIGWVSTIRHVNWWQWSPKRFLVDRRKLLLSSSRWIKSWTLSAEERNIPNTTAIHWRDQENTYDHGCVARKPDSRLLELWLRSKLIGTLERCRAVHKIEWKKLQTDMCGPGRRLTKMLATTSGPECHKQLNEEKSSLGPSKSRSSTMRESWEAFTYFHHYGWHGVQGPHEKRRAKKVGSSLEAAKPCKVRNLGKGETCGEINSNTRNWKYACIVEAHESTRNPRKELYLQIMSIVDRTPTHKTHLCSTVWWQRAPHTQCAWLGSSARPSVICKHLCAQKNQFSHLVCHMSHPWLFSHEPSSMSTSSSSPIYPTTQREHSVHPAHLQAHSVDKLLHQESLWREDQQSGGNPRTTTSTGHEPKELATVSRIEAYSGDPYQLYDVHEKFGEEDHRAPITEEVKEFGKIKTAGVPNSRLSETSYLQSQMHFDDSVESTADSDLEDWELQKMLLTSPLHAQKASWKPDAMVMQEREVSAQYSQADRKHSLRSHSFEGQRASEKSDVLFSSEQGNLIRSSVFRNADPSN